MKERTRPDIVKLYNQLLALYGQQGWWPIHGRYHKGSYDYPKDKKQAYEICIGAILTQNTAWRNVEKALMNLERSCSLEPLKLNSLSDEALASSIRPAGYYNQKVRKLRIFTDYFLTLDSAPSREDLLALWGIGRETADSMLLYAFNTLSFVVDTYTKRLLMAQGIIDSGEGYEEIKRLIEDELPPDIQIYQEFHALIVEHMKPKKAIYRA